VHNQIEIAKRIIELGNDLIKNDKDLSKDLFSQEGTEGMNQYWEKERSNL